MESTPAKHLTVPEVAERLCVSPETVRAWITAGELRGVLVNRTRNCVKRRYVVNLVDLLAFEERRTPKPAPATPRRRKPEPGLIEIV